MPLAASSVTTRAAFSDTRSPDMSMLLFFLRDISKAVLYSGALKGRFLLQYGDSYVGHAKGRSKLRAMSTSIQELHEALSVMAKALRLIRREHVVTKFADFGLRASGSEFRGAIWSTMS